MHEAITLRYFVEITEVIFTNLKLNTKRVALFPGPSQLSIASHSGRAWEQGYRKAIEQTMGKHACIY